MNVETTSIPGVLVIEPRVFADDRGHFFESFNHKAFERAIGGDVRFVQDNQSFSKANVLRGLHFQVEQPQGKLVRAVRGAIYDVAVDIRAGSPAYGTWVGVELSAENRRQLWIPAGLAHGFLVLSAAAEVLYKTTDYYAPAAERCILWNDPTLAIAWPLTVEPVVSAKDRQGTTFASAAPRPV
ncbi:MAG: dTDP-4-dehydrorhamnose 3,5-epimerase [Planctomycetia bacterium]|nr:dTDP-4-dehydrorhamnose 3,5-epimerase [Planctomycetia bacterium]